MSKWRPDTRQLFLSRVFRFTAGRDYRGAYPGLRQAYSICEQDHRIRPLRETKLYSQTSLSSLKTFPSNTFAGCDQLTLTGQRCQAQRMGVSILLGSVFLFVNGARSILKAGAHTQSVTERVGMRYGQVPQHFFSHLCPSYSEDHTQPLIFTSSLQLTPNTLSFALGPMAHRNEMYLHT